MKILFFVACFMFPVLGLADVPDARVLRTDAYNGYATIAGNLTEASSSSIGVTVENGGFKYSTVTDPAGNWSVVIRHRAISYSVKTYSLGEPHIEGVSKTGEIEKKD